MSAKEKNASGDKKCACADYREEVADGICNMIACLRKACDKKSGMSEDVRSEAEVLARATLIFGGHLMDELGLRYEVNGECDEKDDGRASEVYDALDRIRTKGVHERKADAESASASDSVESYCIERVLIENFFKRHGIELFDVHTAYGINHCWAMWCFAGKKRNGICERFFSALTRNVRRAELPDGWSVIDTEYEKVHESCGDNAGRIRTKVYVTCNEQATADYFKVKKEAKTADVEEYLIAKEYRQKGFADR